MEKRTLILGTYNTASDGLWTLHSCELTKPNQVQSFLSVPGRHAPLDFSTYLTDGQPYYESRSMEAVLESSEGNRLDREKRISSMVNKLDGLSMQIFLPDDPDHYLVGRVQVTPDYNDMAHCAVTVSAVCEPWRYAVNETIVTLTANPLEADEVLENNGKLAMVPTLDVTGEVSLTSGDSTWTLAEGTYILPDIFLTPGAHKITYSGTGTLKFTYREAVI